MSESFRALWVTETGYGGFEQSIVQRQLDALPPHELLIRVQYSSLNYKDALSAAGNRGVTRKYPHTPGIDAAGVVVRDASGRFRSSSKVIVSGYDLGMNTPGGLAEYICVPADWAVACPPDLQLREAMVYGTAGLTAALCIRKLVRMGASPADGEIAVSGATGGVGSLAVAILAHLGFDVAAITGKLEASEMLARLGARSVIDRSSLDELAAQALATPQWAHAIDCLGGNYVFTLLKSLHYGGSVAACGLAAAAEFKANVFPFILRNVNLLGVDSVELPLQEKSAAWELLAGDYKPDNLSAIAREITLQQAPHYLEQMINGQSLGRYVVNLKET